MKNQYLIPANSKKSMLILGYFNAIDLVIFGIGVAFTLVMLVVIRTNDIGTLILMITPALVSAFLVMPVPNYHNVMTLIGNIYSFYANKRRYDWKGWCMYDGNNERK